MKNRSWKFWLSRSLLVILFIGIVWVVNLIWFKPFNIRHFYDRIFVKFAISNPELVTSMGIPVLYDWTKDELKDVSDEQLWKEFADLKESYATLMSYDFDRQSPENQLNTKILGWYLKSQMDDEPYFYHNYPVNQMFGIQSNLPSMMENAHKLRNESDVEAYITRLKKFDTKFEQVLEGLRIREEKGIIPPRFVIERILDEMNAFVGKKQEEESLNLEGNPGPVKSNILYTNLADKIKEIEDLDDADRTAYLDQVEEVIAKDVFGAYQKLINFFENQYRIANTQAGVWKLPDGDNFYRKKLKDYTTTDMDPEEVHKIGLKEVERIQEEMWAIFRSQGYTDTTLTIADITQELNQDERFLFQDNDEGRKEIIAEYERILEEISSNLDDAFDIRPKAGLEVRRVPEFKEEGSAAAYYNRPAMDGSRGGLFYANLRDVTETKKFGMKTLAYHEGIPGHHFQIAIQSELKGVPIFRTIGLFTAYIEGWALYTEQLAWELGFYEGDPFGNFGRLQAEMFRAVRLVVDTGIHFKRWTREEAIEYMVKHTGMPRSEVVTEIER
jgi:uncharacterized protein (DUF885 family)